jgi:hypothetical protein
MSYWYETQERAFAPNIADGWPMVIAAPHTKNGRLVRRDGDPAELLAALRALRIDAKRLCDRQLGGSYEADCRRAIAVADAAIDKAEGR